MSYGKETSNRTIDEVLILVVMEYTQWDQIYTVRGYLISSLNPCCNGIYSMSTNHVF